MAMDPLSPYEYSAAYHTDEGYSEDPLNPGLSQSLFATLSALKSPADLPSWFASNVLALPLSLQTELAMALLDQLPTSAIAEIVQRVSPRLFVDFVEHLPVEICLKILGYLDSASLVSVMQTCHAWYNLALDRQLWERLYYLEGWKVLAEQIDACETKVNTNVNRSIVRLHRMPHAAGRTSKVRALLNDDEDLEMTDSDRSFSSANDCGCAGASIFGSPSPTSPPLINMADADVDSTTSLYKGKSIDRSFASLNQMVRAKRKEPGGSPEPALPALLPSDSPGSLVRSTLWAWDISNSRHRINWKYLYSMRRRLESNWELGKYTAFQLPHPLYPEEGHEDCVYTLQFDTKYLVSGSRDHTMRIWNLHTRRLVRSALTGHEGSVLCLQFDADPAEDILVSGSSDSNVFIWKFSTGERVQELTEAHHEPVLNVRFDKRILVTSSKDRTIKIFNRRPLRYGDLGYTVPDDAVDPVATSVKRYGFEPDLAQELPVIPPYTMIGLLDGHGAAVNAIQLRDRTIVSVSGDRHIKVWDWPEEVCIQTILAHDKGIACVEFDERRIVSGSSDFEVCIFDALTGLKVAQLRGHKSLVRTVQAGFGDLPYSREEDELEAKAVDAEYFRAVEAGEISHECDHRSRRFRRVNAGSSRPDEIQAFGAKVPPGGGGGRKYGRIVSGSYDQSIIIWRRDNWGVWKPAHHLRQEEAAADARRRMTASFGPELGSLRRARVASQNRVARHGGARSPGLPSSNSREADVPGGGSQGAAALMPPIRDPHRDSHGSAGLYMALIDRVVPLGAAALEQALENYPAMLAYHSYLQATIGREPSPFVRSQLRQAVTSALARIRNGHSAGRPLAGAVVTSSQPGFHTSSQSPASPSPGAATAGRPGHSQGAASGSGSSRPDGSGASLAESSRPVHPPAELPGQDAQIPVAPAAPIPIPTPVPARAQPAYAPPTQQQPPSPSTHGRNNAQQSAQHHPHVAPAESGAGRVFKLQFDAYKIVCCSQAPVLVGWDFCNGDRELEEAARFFATVD